MVYQARFSKGKALKTKTTGAEIASAMLSYLLRLLIETLLVWSTWRIIAVDTYSQPEIAYWQWILPVMTFGALVRHKPSEVEL